MLNYKWLQTFVILVEQGSFTRCAEHLDVTQAAVSQHVNKLEQRLGPLLIRSTRQFELTQAGRALLDYCQELHLADQRLHTRLQASNEQCTQLHLISSTSIGLPVYPLLLNVQTANPGLVIRQQVASDKETIEAVLENRFELGLSTQKPEDPRLGFTCFTQEPLELVAPASEDVQGWEDLKRIGFIDHPDGQAMSHRVLTRYYHDAPDIDAFPCHGFTNQTHLILEAVARGMGFTVLPRYARLAFARPDEIQVIKGPRRVSNTVWLIHRAQWPLSLPTQQIVQQLRAHFALFQRTTLPV